MAMLFGPLAYLFGVPEVNVMQFRKIHWNEGMFLRPQHFQTADFLISKEIAILGNTLSQFGWGFKKLIIEEQSLENYRFVVSSFLARMPNGTIVMGPEDGPIPILDLKKAFENSTKLTIYLAVPQDSQSSTLSSKSPPKWNVEERELLDENTGTNPEVIQVCSLNFRFLLESEDTIGYIKIPIATLEKTSSGQGYPCLSAGMIPPLISADIWPFLKTDILALLYDRICRKLDLLSIQLPSVGLTSTETGRFAFLQLQALGEAKTTLFPLLNTRDIHPYTLYLELCRIIGKIGFFSPARVPPEPPLYDHENLGKTFLKIRIILEDLLNLVVEPEYKERAFVGAGLRMQVALDPSWVEKGWHMFIGVQGSVPVDQITQILTKPGFLDMKIASSDKVDMIFRSGRAGLLCISANKVPRILPAKYAYFQIQADSTNEEWSDVCKTLALAFRLNENKISSPIQDQKIIKIQFGNDEISMSFTLFVVPERVMAVLEKNDQ